MVVHLSEPGFIIGLRGRGDPAFFLLTKIPGVSNDSLNRKQDDAILSLLVYNPEQSAQVLFVVSPDTNSFVMQRNVLVLFQADTIPLDV